MKIITYNIENYENDWEDRLPLIAELLNEADPDIICLNEVRGLYDGSPNQAEQIQGLLNGYWNLQVTMAAVYTTNDPPQWEGLAILSKEDLLMAETGSKALTTCSDTNNRRIVQFAGFYYNNSDEMFYVFNNHLTTDSSTCYEDQLLEVINFAAQFEGDAFLVGDLNQPVESNLCGDTPCTSERLQLLIDAGWTDLWMQAYENEVGEQGYTWQVGEGDIPSKRIDYIWARGTIINNLENITTLGSCSVNNLYLSDHMAVMASIN